MDTYKTIQGQTWDEIAKEVYNSEKQAGFLMQSNPELLDFFIFPEGIVLRTPDLPEEKRSELPPWRQS